MALTGTDVFVGGDTFTRVLTTCGGEGAPPIFFRFGLVARLNLALTVLEQATYLGGNGDSFVLGLAQNGTDLYAAGDTLATNFTRTAGGAQAASGGGQDAFVARLSDLGTALSCPTAVPTVSPWTLLVLGLLVAVVAWRGARRGLA
jgi:hypothetical protein